MTDYNDGQWHGWNGGECPVHEKTHVDVCDLVSAPRKNVSAGSDVYWPNVIAFRVVNEYREPREWWIWRDGRGRVNDMRQSEITPQNVHFLCGDEIIHVREVQS